VVIDGGFRVDGGRFRQLEQQAERLGFANLRTCLQALSDAGYSVSQLAEELGATRWLVSQALSEFGIQRQDPRARLAQQRRLAAEERVAARMAELGFVDVQAYLADRVAERGWLVAAVVAELGAAPVTVRRLLDRYGIRRLQRTSAEQAAAAGGHRVQQEGWQARRAARLAQLGFADLGSYLRVRVGQGWSVGRMRAEIRVSRAWLVGEMRRLGIKQ
jgi:AraC-like DNA-binding protein